MGKFKEADLFPSIKDYLEQQGYEVYAEVGDIDIIAINHETKHVKAIELKVSMKLSVIRQALGNTGLMKHLTEDCLPHESWVCVPENYRKRNANLWDGIHIARMIGIGVYTISYSEHDEKIMFHGIREAASPDKLLKSSYNYWCNSVQEYHKHNIAGVPGGNSITPYKHMINQIIEYLEINGNTLVKEIRKLDCVKNHYASSYSLVTAIDNYEYKRLEFSYFEKYKMLGLKKNYEKYSAIKK